MVVLDRFIIGAIAGAKAVTYYTVPFQLAERSTIISSALSSALFPRLAAATRQEEHRLALEALRTLVVVMTPLVAGGILLMEPFLSWWISPAFEQQAAGVGKIILLGFWANGFATIPSAQLQARGRPDIVAICHLFELIPYFALLYFGLNYFGMAGAALAFSFRVAVDLILLASLAGILKLFIYSLLTPALFLTAAFSISTLTIPGQTTWILLVVSIFFMIATWAWYQVPAAIRDFLLNWIKTQSK